jgi:hypothetical protein
MFQSTANDHVTLNHNDSSVLPTRCPTGLVELRGRICKYLFDIFLIHDDLFREMPFLPRLEDGSIKVFSNYNHINQEGQMEVRVIFNNVAWVHDGVTPPLCQCLTSVSDLIPCWHEYAAVVSQLGAFPLSLVNSRWILPDVDSGVEPATELRTPLPATINIESADDIVGPPFLDNAQYPEQNLQLMEENSLIEEDSLRTLESNIEHEFNLVNELNRASAPASVASQFFRSSIESIRAKLARVNPSISGLSMDLDSIAPRGRRRNTRRIPSHDEEPPVGRNRSRR